MPKMRTIAGGKESTSSWPDATITFYTYLLLQDPGHQVNTQLLRLLKPSVCPLVHSEYPCAWLVSFYQGLASGSKIQNVYGIFFQFP
jgi:hypothetical protein